MMHGREKSDSAIVAGKLTNKAVLTAAESVERRAGGQGECEPVKHGPGPEPDKPCHRRWSAYGELRSAPTVTHLRREPCAGIQWSSLPHFTLSFVEFDPLAEVSVRTV